MLDVSTIGSMLLVGCREAKPMHALAAGARSDSRKSWLLHRPLASPIVVRAQFCHQTTSIPPLLIRCYFVHDEFVQTFDLCQCDGRTVEHRQRLHRYTSILCDLADLSKSVHADDDFSLSDVLFCHGGINENNLSTFV